VELEDSEGPIPEDLDDEDLGGQEVDGEDSEDDDNSDNGKDGDDGEDGEPIFKDAMNDNMYNSNDEIFESPNRYNEDLEVNGRDEYDFPSDEDNCGYGEGIPLIAKYVDGSSFMSS